jgi:predicted membrane channel-forming protein YqfA (hemolysin III family)
MEFPGTIVKRKRINVVVLLVYVLLGVYFINFPFNFIQIPKYISDANNWIIFLGGLLMLFGAINYFKAKRR